MSFPVSLASANPSIVSIIVQAACLFSACWAVWQFDAQWPWVLSGIVASVAIPLRRWRTARAKQRLFLTVFENGTFAVTDDNVRDNARCYETQIVFAICTTNKLLLRARVWVQGGQQCQEWCLRRTDNEAQWRSACRWIQWLGTKGETKKSQ